MACISFTVTLLKSFEVDSSHMPLSSEVKSSQQWSTWGHFSLKSGHISVPQRLAGLLKARNTNTIHCVSKKVHPFCLQ